MRSYSRAVLFCSLAFALPLQAQSPGWRVTTAPAAGLWFHALALNGASGFGALPLYSAAYRGELSRARARLGLSPTPMDVGGPELGAAFLADSAFEALHFVPLWFPASTAPDLLDALVLATREGAGALRETRLRERFGTRVVLATLPTSDERGTLARFLAGLRREWDEGYPALHGELLPPSRAAEVETAWRPMARVLEPYLAARQLTSGIVLLVPALGPDGRLFMGDPRDPDDNVVAVRLAPGEGADRAVFRLVRELCYPVVREALSGVEREHDRVSGERLSGVAAVRCGHDLLSRYAPDQLAGYDSLWVSEAGQVASFEEVYPLPGAVAAALTSRVEGR